MNKTLIIAEVGPNHNGRLDLAYKYVDEAIKIGADIIKFQTSIPRLGISKHALKADYQKDKNKNENQLKMAEKISLKLNDFYKLKKYCDKKKIEFLTTPFDFESINLINKLKVKRVKIPSGEINNLPYLIEISKLNKEIILSTGMSNMKEVTNAVRIIKKYMKKSKKISILHCTTQYPAPFSDVNLNVIKSLKKKFNCKIGYSDHTTGIEVAIAAVAMGATIIEKHLTFDKKMKGPDHKASLEPHEFKNMVLSIRNIEKSFGSFKKVITKSEKKNILIARKSIVANKFIEKGEKFTLKNITVKRPSLGLSPTKWFSVLGKTAKKDYFEDDYIKI
jgi:N,N'-diacetyllegionaminate synthase